MPAAEEAVELIASLAPDAVERTVSLVLDAPLAVLPMILSFMLVMEARVRRTRRSTMRGGLNFSLSASTSALSSRCV